MTRKSIVYLCLSLVLLIGCTSKGGLSSGKYTASTFIEVLPYAEQDPFIIGPPAINKEIQESFCTSIATLICQQSIFQDLINRNRIQETEWFKSFGEDKGTRIRKAIKDLEKNFTASAEEGTDYIKVSMTCNSANEAALIVNEMVSYFISAFGSNEKKEITERLASLREQRQSLHSQLEVAEKALDQVRSSSGFTDLQQRAYPHPVTVRLNQLQNLKDNLVLNIAEAEAVLKSLDESSEEAKDAGKKLNILQAKFMRLDEMLKETKAQKRALDQACILYAQRARIKDGVEKRLGEVGGAITKLMTIYDDPRVAKVKSVGLAPVPLEPN